MTVWIKQGVIGDLQPIARKGLGKVASLYESKGLSLCVTSFRDGNHMAGSLHYDGLAFDFVPVSEITINDIKQILGPQWDVINEQTHIHCEFDPKK